MTAVAFDTLKFVRALREKAKLSPEQAEGFADAIAEAVQSDLATKPDIEALRLSTKADIEALRLSTKADIEALRAATRAEIAEAKADIIKWMFGTIGFQTLIIVGAIVALTRLVKP